MAYLSIKNIVKKYSKETVLDNLTMYIEKGEISVIIGESGNGKTTLLRCLNGLTAIDEGEVFLNGEKIDLLNNKEFGLIFQSFNLFPQYNVLTNITLPLNSMYKKSLNKLSFIKKQRMLKLKKQESERIAYELLEKINLKDKAFNYPCELSGGQCQRVAIARALALKPNVLCFDEPTSALDPKTTLEVAKIIKDLKAEGYTLLIITHDISFAKQIADKVFFLKKGRILEYGNVEEILISPKNEEIKSFLGSNNEEN